MSTEKIFIGREKELGFLQKRYDRGKPEFIILYGRRRIGKTELIKKFLEGKKSVYHLVARESEKDQIEEFHQTLGSTFSGFTDLQKDWEVLLRQFQKKERIIIAIDEFQYLIETNPEILKRFQKIWDEFLCQSKVMLILTGSSIGMMENEILGYKSPLYGRRTGQWNLKPFGFRESTEFFPNYSMEDRIRTYGILGGTPFFLQQFEPENGLKENILDEILDTGSVLRDEAVNLLREEFREPRNYFSILKAIATGHNDFGNISNETEIHKNSLSKYLLTLQDLRLVRKVLPVTASAKSKKAHYHISDNYLSFWFRFVFPNQTVLEQNPEKLLMDIIIPNMDVYTSLRFEDLCREALVEKGMNFSRIGTWWYKENEIDIVALNEIEKRILFGECKWTKKRVQASYLKKLENKSKMVRWKNTVRKEEFVIFSRSGFTNELKDMASQRNDLMLFDLKDLEWIFGNV